MTFEEWWETEIATKDKWVKEIAQAAWEAGIQGGINRMYLLYDMCPECKLSNGVHKMDCSNGR